MVDPPHADASSDPGQLMYPSSAHAAQENGTGSAAQLERGSQSPVSVHSGDDALDSETRPVGALHLTPCTLEQYFELGSDREDRYELEEGVLISIPMADDEHGQILWALGQLICLLPSDWEPQVAASYDETVVVLDRELPVEETSPRAGDGVPSSSQHVPSGKRKERKPTVRRPDLTIVAKRDESSGSNGSRASHEPGRSWKPFEKRMLVELTSNNRKTDLDRKKEEYEKEKLPEYVIIDRHKTSKYRRDACVYVYKYCEARKRFVKGTFARDQKVECSFFSHYNLKAWEMMDVARIRSIVRAKSREKKAKDRRMREEIERLTVNDRKNKEAIERLTVNDRKNKEENRKKSEEIERLKKREERIRELERDGRERRREREKRRREEREREREMEREREKLRNQRNKLQEAAMKKGITLPFLELQSASEPESPISPSSHPKSASSSHSRTPAHPRTPVIPHPRTPVIPHPQSPSDVSSPLPKRSKLRSPPPKGSPSKHRK